MDDNLALACRTMIPENSANHSKFRITQLGSQRRHTIRLAVEIRVKIGAAVPYFHHPEEMFR